MITGAKLTAREINAFVTWVRGGGRLIWHGLDAWTWGTAVVTMLGAEPVDFRASATHSFTTFVATWSVSRFQRDIFLRLRLGGVWSWPVWRTWMLICGAGRLG